MMFSRIIILTVFFYMQCVLYSAEPEIVISKIFPLDSSYTASCKIMNCTDGNILITANSRISFYSSKETFQNIKLNQTGDIIWKNKTNLETGYEVTDIFEFDTNYFIVASTTLKIGQYFKNVQTVLKIDNEGNTIYHNIDSFSNTSIYSPWFTKKHIDKLISFQTSSHSSYLYMRWLYYDFESNFISYKTIDTFFIPDLFEIWNNKVTITYDNSIIYAITALLNNNTCPHYYIIYNSEGEYEKHFLLNQNIQILTPSRTGPSIKLKNGDYLLSGRIHLYNNDLFDFIRRVDSEGNLIWEDTLKNEFVTFNNIIEDDFGNILVCGHKYNKPNPTHNLLNYNYFYLSCYEKNGKNKFKKVWGDSSVNNELRELTVTDENNIFAVGSLAGTPYLVKISYNPTKVNEFEIKNKNLLIFSNPASDFIEIHLNNEASLIASGKVQLFDILGIIIKDLTPTFSINVEGVRIDVSGLHSGVYFIRIGDRVEKFVKM